MLNAISEKDHLVKATKDKTKLVKATNYRTKLLATNQIYLISLGVSKEMRKKPTAGGDKHVHEQSSISLSFSSSGDNQAQEENISGAPSSSKGSPYYCEGIFTKVHKKVTREILTLFHCFAEITGGSNYVIILLGEVSQLY